MNNLATSGSLAVLGGSAGSPVITVAHANGQLTLSWNSAAYPGYHVQVQTNSAGLGTNWTSATGGTVSPYSIAINPTNRTVFFRLANP